MVTGVQTCALPIYIERNSEMIEIAIKEWPGVLAKGAKIKTWKAFLNMAKDALGTIQLVHLFEDPDFNQLLKTQQMTHITWSVSPQWKISWLWQLLTSPSGGVGGVSSGAMQPLLTAYAIPVAYCSDGATHVYIPQAPY